jgi:hypothetical protein
MSIVRGAGGSSVSNGWGVYISSSGELRLQSGSGSTGNDSLVLASGMQPDIWYTLVITYDNGVVNAYVNNVLTATDTRNIGWHTTTPENYNLQFGSINGLAYFSGNIDSAGYYPRIITTDERLLLSDGLPYSEFGASSDIPTDNVIFVSAAGNDSNDGKTIEAPIKTISKLNSMSIDAGKTVLFRRGDNFRGKVTVPSSGTTSNKITFGAYGTGAKPIINGTNNVSGGWTVHSGNIYKKSVSGSIYQVFLNKTRVRPARYPKVGWFLTGSGTSGTSVYSDSLTTGANYVGSKIFIRPNYFTGDIKTVTGQSGKTLTIDSTTRHALVPGRGFFLMNKLEYLTQPGEWYHDGNTLYVWGLNSEDINTLTVEVSNEDRGFEVLVKPNIVIKDLEIYGQREYGIIVSGRSHNFDLSNCYIHGQEFFGVFSGDNSSSNPTLGYDVNNNIFEGQNGAAIYLRLSESSVRNNVVDKIALHDQIGLGGTKEDNLGGGIFVSSEFNTTTNVGGGNVISNNRVTNVGYYGIQWSGRNCIIENNFVNNAVLLKADNGGIYGSWYNRTSNYGLHGSIVRKNIVLNCVGPVGPVHGYVTTSNRKFGHGIYIDESAKDVTVEDNVVAFVSDACIRLHVNEGAIVRNNLVFGGRALLTAINSSGSLKNKFENNTVVIEDGVDEDNYYPRECAVYNSNGNATFTGNNYYNAFENRGTAIFKDSSPFLTFSQWQGNGYDVTGTYNAITLATGESQYLFYNDSLITKVYDVTGTNVRKLDGTAVGGTITIPAMGGIILIGSNVTLAEQ